MAIRESRTDSLPVMEEASSLPVRWLELFPQFPEIIRKVSQGILIAFSDDAPTLLHRPLELGSNNKPSVFLQAVKKLLDSQAIKEVKDTLSLGYYSHLFLVPKPDGSFRPIIDLKKLNLFLDVPSFKMKTLFSIIAALQPQEWITKIDLKDAYHHILVHVNIRKKDLSVLCAPVWCFDSTQRVHKDLGTVSSAASHQRDQSLCLSQRLNHPGGFIRKESSAYQSNHPTFTDFRMDYQLEEVYARTLTHTGLLGTALQFRTSHCFSSGLLRFSHQCPIPSFSVHGHVCMQDNLYNQSDLAFCPIYPSRMPSSQVPAVLDKMETLVTRHPVLGHSDPTGYGISHTSTMVQPTGSSSRSPLTLLLMKIRWNRTFPRSEPMM